MVTPGGAVAGKRGERPRDVEEDEAAEDVVAAVVAASMAMGGSGRPKEREKIKKIINFS